MTRRLQLFNEMNYKWYILGLSAATFIFGIAMPMMSMPVLFKQISEDLDLTLVQVGSIWGMTGLAGIFVTLIGGLLSDRLGVKRVLTFACLLAGITGASRGFSNSFASLMLTTFLFGLTGTILPVNVHKNCGIWFSSKQLGLANGVVSMGMALGFTLGAMISATVLSPLLGGWERVMFLYGGISIIIGILWSVSKVHSSELERMARPETRVPFIQSLGTVVRIKELWLLGIVLLLQLGCVQGLLGYLPLYLRSIGWNETAADGSLAAFNGISMAATVPIALLSDRLEDRRRVLFAATLMTALGVGLLYVVDGALVWVAVAIAGVVRDGFMAVFMARIIETEGVGSKYSGTALGLVLTLSRVGALVAPPTGNSLGTIRPDLPFLFWAGLAAAALFLFIFIPKGVKRW